MGGFASVLFRFSVFPLLLFYVFPGAAAGSYSTVKHLPGFSGPLPFDLETGYVGVGERDEAQLFYYFIKSDRNPKTDPLILFLTGGPGCSALSGLAFEIGPIEFKEEPNNGSIPQLNLNPYSWTKTSNIIFLDSPVGTGFSYDTTSTLVPGDYNQIHHCLQFLRKWLVDHPKFMKNPFYVGGDSYSGMIVPIVAQEILEGNKRVLPSINFQGYILGNPYTIQSSNDNFAVPFAHRMTLISDELFESLKSSCKGEYKKIDPSNVECLRHYETYQKCISEIERACILLPRCEFPGSKRKDRRSLYNIQKWSLKSPSFDHQCPEFKYVLSNRWANNDQVRKALHIREETVEEWKRCSRDKKYIREIESVVTYHANLSSKGYRSLIYSGDHDILVPHLATQAWIKDLNYSIVDDWRPWFISDQVAGYTRSYANKMTFATIKGGGHTAEYTRKECSIMFSRWISGQPL